MTELEQPGRFQEALSDEESQSQSNSDSEYGDEQVTWIEWFCHLKGNEFLVEVDDEFAQDDFNLTYLNKEVAEYFEQDLYREALNMILDYDDDDDLSESRKPLIESAAQCLYGLIHARFLLTARGMALMFEKFNAYTYGSCPLLDCHAQNQAVLPIGISDIVGKSRAKVYCPRCKEMYAPKSSRLEQLDGAYFGTSFPHLFFLTYAHLKPSTVPRTYVPRIFGFRVSRHMKTAMRKAALDDVAAAQAGNPVNKAEELTPREEKESGEQDASARGDAKTAPAPAEQPAEQNAA